MLYSRCMAEGGLGRNWHNIVNKLYFNKKKKKKKEKKEKRPTKWEGRMIREVEVKVL